MPPAKAADKHNYRMNCGNVQKPGRQFKVTVFVNTNPISTLSSVVRRMNLSRLLSAYRWRNFAISCYVLVVTTEWVIAMYNF